MHSSITEEENYALERVQKVALKLILRGEYTDYEDALLSTDLETLNSRRTRLCLTFARKCVKNEKTCKMFPLNPRTDTFNTRHKEKYFVTHANTSRLKNSAIPYMQRLLNCNL